MTASNAVTQRAASDFRVGKRDEQAFGEIASIAYERDLIIAIASCLKIFKSLDLTPTFLVSMAMLGCKGSQMAVDLRQRPIDRHTIDRNVAMLPDVAIEQFDADVPAVMKPIFDAVWNACGYPGSHNYDSEGKWNPR